MTNYTRHLNKQGGASLGAIIFNVGILIFIGFAAAKVVVFYFDNNLVKKTLAEMKDVPYITKKSSIEVHGLMEKRLRMNNIELAKDEVIVEKKSDRLIIRTVYERRANLFANIDVVVSFDNEFEAVRN